MITPEQKNYVATQRNKGLSDTDITKALLQHGYTNEQVSELLSGMDSVESKKASFFRFEYSAATVRRLSLVGLLLLIGFVAFWIYSIPTTSESVFLLMAALVPAALFYIPTIMLVVYLLTTLVHYLQKKASVHKPESITTNRPLNRFILLIILYIAVMITNWSLGFLGKILENAGVHTFVAFIAALFLFFVTTAAYKTYTSTGFMRYAFGALIVLVLVMLATIFGLLLL